MDNRPSKAPESAFPLKTHLDSMSDRTRALLEYYFNNDCRAYFSQVAEQDKPDVVIVDYDHPGARASVAAGAWQTDRPLLLLSFTETSVEGAVVVSKPFDKHQLQQAALRLVDETLPVKQVVAEQDSAAPAADEAEVPIKPEKLSADNSLAAKALNDQHDLTPLKDAAAEENIKEQAKKARQETKVVLLCGPYRSLADLESVNNKTHRFTSAIHLSGRIEKALQQCGHDGVIAVQLTLPTMEIYVLHWLQKILTTASMKSSKNIGRAFRSLSDDEVTLTSHSSDTVNELVKRVNGTGKFSFSTEAFLWLSALFSARGRLPDDVHLDQTWRMTHWPNLTRLEPVPQAVETASAWSREPSSIRQIIERTGHQPRHVTSFFNGARALKLMEPVPSGAENTNGASSNTTETDTNMSDRENPEQG